MKLKKPSLIVQIFLGMLIGILIGVLFPVIKDAKPPVKKETAQVEKKGIQKIQFPITEEQVQLMNNNLQKIDEKLNPKKPTPKKESFATRLKVLSDIFMLLIKMIIAPLVISVLIVGIAKVGDFKSVGRIGIKTLLYFTSAAIIALLLGLFLVNVFSPGEHMSIELPQKGAEIGIETAKKFNIKNVSPSSVVDEMDKKKI